MRERPPDRRIVAPDDEESVTLRGILNVWSAREKRLLGLILLLFVVLGVTYSAVNPIFEGTDELRHFRFVRVLADTGRLPVQGQEPRRSQSHHPPLYYALSAAATFWVPNQGDPYLNWPKNPFWGFQSWQVGVDNKAMYLHGPNEGFPWSGVVLAVHLARLVNVGLGALAVALAALGTRLAFPRRPALAYGAAALLAFNPMFLYMSGTVNNDVAATAAGAALVVACLVLLRDGLEIRRLLTLGVVLGLALLAKFHLVGFLPLIEGVLLWRTCFPVGDGRRSRAAFLRANLAVLAPAVLLSGWWFVRNQVLYGDPAGFQEVTELWGVRAPLESIGLAWSELPNAWSSLWGRFGYGQIPLPGWVYAALAWAVVLGCLGALLGIIRLVRRARQGDGAARNSLPALTLLALVVLTYAGILVRVHAGEPGRFHGAFLFSRLARFGRAGGFWLVRMAARAGPRGAPFSPAGARRRAGAGDERFDAGAGALGAARFSGSRLCDSGRCGGRRYSPPTWTLLFRIPRGRWCVCWATRWTASRSGRGRL